MQILFFKSYSDPRNLHSFPTRRSSDLLRRHPRGDDPLHRDERGAHRRLAARLLDWHLPPDARPPAPAASRLEEHTFELQSPPYPVCRLPLEKKNHTQCRYSHHITQLCP